MRQKELLRHGRCDGPSSLRSGSQRLCQRRPLENRDAPGDLRQERLVDHRAHSGRQGTDGGVIGAAERQVKVEVGGIGEISDPPLVTTDYPHYYLRLSPAFKFIKTEPRARHAWEQEENH